MSQIFLLMDWCAGQDHFSLLKTQNMNETHEEKSQGLQLWIIFIII